MTPVDEATQLRIERAKWQLRAERMRYLLESALDLSFEPGPIAKKELRRVIGDIEREWDRA